MARVSKKLLKLGTGSGELNAADLPANYSATNYTATSSDTKGHLEGIDNTLGGLSSAGDISETSFSGANNQVTPANVTSFAFANGTVRSFEALASISVDATTDLFEVVKIMGIQKGADWDISISSTGDDSLVDFTITSAGQIQYTSGNYAGFVSLTVKFRAITTSV